MRLRFATRLASALLVVTVAAACDGCALDFARYLPVGTDGAVDAQRADSSEVRSDVPSFDVADAIDAPITDEPMDAVDTIVADAGCGEATLACCSSGTNGGCAAGTQCTAGICASCGGTGASCCGGSACDAGLTCVGGTCHPDCGASGQPCCAGTCASGTTACIGGMCVACGGIGDPCCTDGACSGTSFCSDPTHWSTAACIECGHFGQLCCPSATGCVEGSCQAIPGGPSVCLGAPSGVMGGYCPPAAAGAYCSDGSLCTPDNYCESCGSFTEVCCGGVDCASGFACSSGQCL